jgi:hypothetical protein
MQVDPFHWITNVDDEVLKVLESPISIYITVWGIIVNYSVRVTWGVKKMYYPT